MRRPRLDHPCGSHPFDGGRPLQGLSRMVVTDEQPMDCGGDSVGVSAPLARGQSSFDSETGRFPISGKTGGRGCYSSRSASSFKEGSDRRGSRLHFSGVLRETLCSPKGVGGWRPVLNLSPPNLYLRKIRFSMETPMSVRESLRPSDWVTSIDLTDAYFHILIHQADQKRLLFVWGDKVFQFRALPFGLSLALWIFTMIIRQFCGIIRGQGVRLRTYLDD